jgi:hypothetical protein
MQRFEIEPALLEHYTDGLILLCRRCEWKFETADVLTLAELVQRADEHTEVCR